MVFKVDGLEPRRSDSFIESKMHRGDKPDRLIMGPSALENEAPVALHPETGHDRYRGDCS